MTRCALLLLAGAGLAANAEDDGATWALDTAHDPATYRDIAVLYRAATQAIKDEYARKDVRPRLEFRCEPGAGQPVDVRIDWQRFISSFNADVRYQADGEEPMVLTMGVDRSNKITSSRNADDGAAMIDYLRDRTSLQVDVTPYSDAPLTVHFSLDGFDAAVEKLREACSG